MMERDKAKLIAEMVKLTAAQTKSLSERATALRSAGGTREQFPEELHDSQQS